MSIQPLSCKDNFPNIGFMNDCYYCCLPLLTIVQASEMQISTPCMLPHSILSVSSIRF